MYDLFIVESKNKQQKMKQMNTWLKGELLSQNKYKLLGVHFYLQNMCIFRPTPSHILRERERESPGTIDFVRLYWMTSQ